MERFAKKEAPTSVTNAELYIYVSRDRGTEKGSKRSWLRLLVRLTRYCPRYAAPAGLQTETVFRRRARATEELLVSADKYVASFFVPAPGKKKFNIMYTPGARARNGDKGRGRNRNNIICQVTLRGRDVERLGDSVGVVFDGVIMRLISWYFYLEFMDLVGSGFKFFDRKDRFYIVSWLRNR